MTAKDYYRSLALQDLGFPLDGEVLEMHEYITERLSNLNQYISKDDPNVIYYGKSKDELILLYDKKDESINLYYKAFSNKLHCDISDRIDIRIITSKYIVEILQIKVNLISNLWFDMNYI